ncbi:MAG: hypothetical protein QM445_02835 [Thermotogota bacterium]|nr:hypothetical protein [Thermotogota bacterium]
MKSSCQNQLGSSSELSNARDYLESKMTVEGVVDSHWNALGHDLDPWIVLNTRSCAEALNRIPEQEIFRAASTG